MNLMRLCNPRWILLSLVVLCASLIRLNSVPTLAQSDPATVVEALRVRVTPPAIEVLPFVTGLNRPLGIVQAGDERLFVVEQGGWIRIVPPDGTLLPEAFL